MSELRLRPSSRLAVAGVHDLFYNCHFPQLVHSFPARPSSFQPSSRLCTLLSCWRIPAFLLWLHALVTIIRQHYSATEVKLSQHAVYSLLDALTCGYMVFLASIQFYSQFPIFAVVMPIDKIYYKTPHVHD